MAETTDKPQPTAASLWAAIQSLENQDRIGIAGANKLAELRAEHRAAVEREAKA